MWEDGREIKGERRGGDDAQTKRKEKGNKIKKSRERKIKGNHKRCTSKKKELNS